MSQTLAIADSSALFRLGVRNMARQIEGIEVVGEAASGEDLIGLVDSFEPSVVVVDFLSSGFDIDVVRRVKAAKPRTRILAITTQQSGHTLVNALRAGWTATSKKIATSERFKMPSAKPSKEGRSLRSNLGQDSSRVHQC